MAFDRINYEEGTGKSSKQIESYNFHKAAAVLVEYGFDCIRISDDWEGADFLAHRKESGETLMVQLKTGLVIDKKYCHLPDLYMCFPLDNTGKWYLIKHSDLIQLVREHSKRWFDSSRWKKQNMYWSWRANEAMRKALEPYSYSPCYPGHGFREARQKVTKALTKEQKDA